MTLPDEYPHPPTPTEPPTLAQEQNAVPPLQSPPEYAGIAPSLNVVQWRCSKGHVSSAIGLYFHAGLLGGDQSQGPLSGDKRFCYICLIEFLEKSGISEVERVQ